MKRCKKCGETKPLEDFYQEKAGRDGHRPECKACNLAAKKLWYANNRDRAIATVKQWQTDNPERVLESRRAYRAANPEKIREGHLRRRFGLTLDGYAAMLEAQGGRCAICGRPEPPGKSLHVDHDHETGVVRGLLCFSCNAAIGKLADDVDRLQRAIAYLDGGGCVPAEVAEQEALVRSRAAALTVGGARTAK
jgi:hypothetical protein